MGGVIHTLEDIKDSIPNCKVDLSVLTEKPKKEKSKLSLDEAKKLYPEWYEKRIVQGEPKQQSKKLTSKRHSLILERKR